MNVFSDRGHFTSMFSILNTLLEKDNLELLDYLMMKMKDVGLNKLLTELDQSILAISALAKHHSLIFSLIDAGLNPNMQIMFGKPIGYLLAIEDFPLIEKFINRYRNQLDGSSKSAIREALTLKYPDAEDKIIQLRPKYIKVKSQ